MTATLNRLDRLERGASWVLLACVSVLLVAELADRDWARAALAAAALLLIGVPRLRRGSGGSPATAQDWTTARAREELDAARIDPAVREVEAVRHLRRRDPALGLQQAVDLVRACSTRRS